MNFNKLSIIWIGGVYLILTLSSLIFEKDFVLALRNWDAGHFLGIAEFGYKDKFQYAFMPLYPLLIRSLSIIFKDYLFSAIFISLVSSYLAMSVLQKLIKLEFKKKYAKKIILSIFLFPTSFYLLIAYSESLFFLFAVLFFFFYKKKQYLYANLFAGMASVTRFAGISLILVLFLEAFFFSRNIKKTHLFISISPLLIYLVFLYSRTGNAFYFLTAQTHWQRELIFPTIPFWHTISKIASTPLYLQDLSDIFNLVFVVLGLGLVLRSFRYLPARYSIYSFFSLSLALFSGSLVSIPRFLITIFPIFITISLIKNRLFLITYFVVSALLLIYFQVLYIRGIWVS